MDDREQFMLIETIIALFLLGITFIEIYDPVRFDKVITEIMSSTSWFLGLTIGLVTSGVLRKTKSKIDKFFKKDQQEGKFLMFIAGLFVFSLIVTIASKLAFAFLTTYREFFHLIFVQWFVIVYIWFKLSNKFEIHSKYVITTQLIILACAILVVWRLF